MIPDRVLDHLRAVMDELDLSGTRYEAGPLIGKGGMGAVYRVRDRLLDREVALKVGEGFEEAKTLAKLEHPGIVPIYDAGTLADGRGYCVMRLVDGSPLKRFDGLAECLSVAGKICEAVGFAHSQGVIHRDLKPANILIGKFGQVMVLDWGIALLAGASGSRAGTRRYMAPEREVDARTDIFALGVLFEEILPVAAPKPLLAIAAKARAAEPGLRYSEVAELAEDLRRFQDQLAVSAYQESLWERGLRFASRNKVLLLLLGSYVVVRLLLFIFRPV